LGAMIARQAQDGCYVSFIGIGVDFHSELAEEVTKHPGANYFCVTRSTELEKVVVNDFDWNFIPVAFGVAVTCQSNAFDVVGVYGTPFDMHEEATAQAHWQEEVHSFYPEDFRVQAKALMLCTKRCRLPNPPLPALQRIFDYMSPQVCSVIQVDTAFPSAVLEDGAVEGGLVLLRLRAREGLSSHLAEGHIKLVLRYKSLEGVASAVVHNLGVPLRCSARPLPPLPNALEKGLLLQRYVEVCRRYLSLAQSADTTGEVQEGALGDAENLLHVLQSMSCKALRCCGIADDLKGFCKLARRQLQLPAPSIVQDTQTPVNH